MAWAMMVVPSGGILVTPVSGGGVAGVLVGSGGSAITLVPSGGMAVTFSNPEALPEPYRAQLLVPTRQYAAAKRSEDQRMGWGFLKAALVIGVIGCIAAGITGIVAYATDAITTTGPIALVILGITAVLVLACLFFAVEQFV